MEEYRVRYQQWLDDPSIDEETKAELRSIANDENEIKERFFKELEFGTGNASMGQLPKISLISLIDCIFSLFSPIRLPYHTIFFSFLQRKCRMHNFEIVCSFFLCYSCIKRKTMTKEVIYNEMLSC